MLDIRLSQGDGWDIEPSLPLEIILAATLIALSFAAWRFWGRSKK